MKRAEKRKLRAGVRIPQYKHVIDFSGVKWNRSDLEIAMSLGCSKATVTKKRKELKIAPVKDQHSATPLHKRPKPIKLDFESPIAGEEYGLEI
jgi:hypothetical protein